MIKKLVAVMTLVSFLMVGCGQTSSSKDNSLDNVKKSGQIVIGLDDSFPPMGFRDEKGEIVGFDIDLAKEAAKRIGIKAEFKPVDWDGVLLSLNNKDIDVIWNGLTITEDRKEKIAFSEEYLTNKQIIMVNKNSSINNKSHLKGKVVGLQMGSSSEEVVNNNKDLASSIKELKKYSKNTDALMDLKAGRVDAVVIDEVVGRYYMNKKKEEYKILEEDLGKESYGIGIRKNDNMLLQELNKVMKDMKDDGTVKSISEKWFGKDSGQ